MAVNGSDAIAGVVNIILDPELVGLRAQADLGNDRRGDGRLVHASPA